MKSFYDLNFMMYSAVQMLSCDVRLIWINLNLAMLKAQKRSLEAQLKKAEQMNAKYLSE